MSSLIDSVSVRVEVTGLEEALPLYQTLTGVQEPRVREFPEFKVAAVGPFLLLEGDPEALEKHRRTATLRVGSLHAAVSAFVDSGGRVIDGPVTTPAGTRTIVQDRDGNAFECLEPGA